MNLLRDRDNTGRPTEYVTFFDSVYLPQGLALYRSIQRHDAPGRLTVYAMDAMCIDALEALSLPHLVVRDAWERLPSTLRDLRGRRDRVSLLWTSTPFVIQDRLKDLDPEQNLYYVDADLALFRSPAAARREFEASGCSVLITAHNFAAEYDAADSVGEFAVQFLGFRKAGSEVVLNAWSAQCLQACPTSPSDGAFGDQKYLDEWPKEFADRVHIASSPEWFQGPWNATRFPASRAIAYHFHGLRIMGKGRVRLTTHYRLPSPTITTLYEPYVRELATACELLGHSGFAVPAQAIAQSTIGKLRSIGGRLRRAWRETGGPRYLSMSSDIQRDGRKLSSAH